jgi:hypothetical protein
MTSKAEGCPAALASEWREARRSERKTSTCRVGARRKHTACGEGNLLATLLTRDAYVDISYGSTFCNAYVLMGG